MTAISSKPRTDRRKARPKSGARLGGMTDSDIDRVTESEARAIYIGMQGRRSILGVRKRLAKGGRKTPSVTTFKKWSAKHGWRRLAREHDDKVVAETTAKLAKAAVAEAVTRAHQFDTLATESLTKAIAGLEKVNVDDLKVSDIRALAEVGERASKMFELLEGRATDRPDDMTREKMDALLDEMTTEIEEKLARFRTVH